LALNTSIAKMMELLNFIDANRGVMTPQNDDEKRVIREAAEAWVRLLVPIAPFAAEELWSDLGQKPSILQAAWPVADAEIAKESEIEYPVQVNGKLRGKFTTRPDASEEDLKQSALKVVEGEVKDKTIAKVIVVKGRLVNVVIK
jgi:leucyl-tRNA synthetase